TDSEQLARYESVTSEDLRQRARVPTRAWATHDVVVVGLQEHEERLTIGITAGGHSFPLVLAFPDGLALRLNSFRVGELNDGLAPKLLIDMSRAPMSFVPFERGSPLWMVAETIIPRLLKHMLNRSSRVDAAALAADAVPTWPIMSPQQKNEIAKAVRDVLIEAEKVRFARFIKRRGNSPEWDIVENPLDLETDKRSREYRNLRKAHENLLSDLRAGVRPSKQLDLLVSEPSEPESR
ncbi:MAG TPA: hypothetical protein VJ837_01660, partial [Candidatus Paceibacterota bacterium]|nr:hypothetical protein [Candidatus Paceibacterota bacterium]